MAGTDDHDTGDHQRADHLDYSGNTYPQPSDDPEACLQNSHRHVADLNDLNGSRDEYH